MCPCIRVYYLLLLVFALVDCQVRVEYKLHRLFNKDGQTAGSKNCDMSSDCDHLMTAYLDIDNPNDPWPGLGRKVKDWARVFSVPNDNSPFINKIVSRDICRDIPAVANLRLNVVDDDRMTKNDLVEQFECKVPMETVSASEQTAPFSVERECRGNLRPEKMSVMYRYRIFRIPASQCGKHPGAK